jgi:hypothetical protein
MEEAAKYKVENIEVHLVLKNFEDVFREIMIFAPNIDIEFSIDLVSGAAPMSTTPYIMGTLEYKEFHMQLEELLKKGCVCQSVASWGAPVLFVKEKY